MKIRILKDEKCINKLEIKEKSFDAIRKIGNMQREEDIMKLGKLGRAELGINSLTTKDGITFTTDEKLSNVVLDGTDMGFPIDVRMYQAGWVLNTGRVGSNIFGGRFDAYFKRFTSRKVISSPKGDAKVFASLKALISYIEENKNNFEFLVKKHGFYWSLETANALFEEDLREEYSKNPKKQVKDKALEEEISKLLDAINETESEEEEFEVPEEITPEAMKEEAIFRMKKFSMWDRVISDFKKKGKIFQSEAGGIIYNLNDKAKVAVERIEKEGYLPYAVVVTNTTFGELYSVLYVSTNGEDWSLERPNSNGIALNYTYNATDDIFSEYDSSTFIGVNGGLMVV